MPVKATGQHQGTSSSSYLASSGVYIPWGGGIAQAPGLEAYYSSANMPTLHQQNLIILLLHRNNVLKLQNC